eukprot:13384364-Alexandrium_andersonii.AAC.1
MAVCLLSMSSMISDCSMASRASAASQSSRAAVMSASCASCDSRGWQQSRGHSASTPCSRGWGGMTSALPRA